MAARVERGRVALEEFGADEVSDRVEGGNEAEVLDSEDFLKGTAAGDEGEVADVVDDNSGVLVDGVRESDAGHGSVGCEVGRRVEDVNSIVVGNAQDEASRGRRGRSRCGRRRESRRCGCG